ncbi:MAG: DUF47 family protein [Parabacteroides sp.]|nr:DUF47 family protein [Parabacteroides sp.]MBP8758832.1 DUF47 family protein [Parabacteroides sp.]MBP9578255.1 DUF47 family protein [Parabacteroides sp.]
MKINTLLSVFAPKDVKFFPLLDEATSILVQSSVLLKELFSTENPERRIELCRLIKAEEVKGDKITKQTFKALNDTFLTPFDREDIHELADILDDVIDIINRCGQKVLLYSPKTLNKNSALLVDIIQKGCLELQLAVNELQNLKKTDAQLRNHCREIKRLEEEADGIYETAIMSLFKEETSSVELIKMKEITQELEKAVNKINSTGKVIKSILVKYA